MSQVRSSDITTAGWMVAALLALGACRADGPDIAAVEPEPGDPSVYAPAEWPLQIGDRVSRGWRNGSHDEFPAWAGLEALHAIGDEVYSARTGRPIGEIWGGDGWLRELDRSVAERVAERLAWESRAPLRDREDRREGTR